VKRSMFGERKSREYPGSAISTYRVRVTGSIV
jgi:hypothetical protein